MGAATVVGITRAIGRPTQDTVVIEAMGAIAVKVETGAKGATAATGSAEIAIATGIAAEIGIAAVSGANTVLVIGPTSANAEISNASA
jgi:hypothetical protein